MAFMMFAGLFGGLGMFIYGMHIMSEGLKVVAGSRMKSLLEALTSTKFKALLCGIIVTMMVQSSSTTTVMVVGFVNASIMTLQQAAGIILGSNIGTTVMAQIIAFDITSYAPLFIGIGSMMMLFSKKKKVKEWGNIILGFGILFFGINTMTSAVEPLKDSPEFIHILTTYGKNQWIGLLVSAALTGILQSSGAIIGLVQALAISGVFSGTTGTEAIQICIPIIIGSNIGTCVTALLSSIGTSNAAKDAAMIHLFVNIFGAIWVMAAINLINFISGPTSDPVYEFIVAISGTSTNAAGQVVPNYARQIAMAHTIFNVANTIVLYPIIDRMVLLIEKMFPPAAEEIGLQLDQRLLNNPAVALGQVNSEIVRMSEKVKKNFDTSVEAVLKLDEELIKDGYKREETIDEFEHGILEFLQGINTLNMSDHQNALANYYMNCVHDLERIGDYSVNMIQAAEAMIDRESRLNVSMAEDITTMKNDINLMITQVGTIIEKDDISLCEAVITEEEEIDILTAQCKENCVMNMYHKVEGTYTTFAFVDMLTNIERIGDHANNIAVGLIRVEHMKDINQISEVVY